MLRRSLYLITALIVAVALPAFAGTAVCSVASGPSGPLTQLSDCSPLFTPTAILDWGAPNTADITSSANTSGLGPAYSSVFPEPLGTSLYAGINGESIQIQSNDMLTREDNAALAWSNAYDAWIPAAFAAPNLNFFAGNFGTATSSAGYNAYSPYGDDLLGAIAPSGPSQGVPTMTFTFTQVLSYVAFQVSSATNSNFSAELIAYNAQGQQIGVYMVNDTGDGGSSCAAMGNPDGPMACNTAPLIQFYDPNAQIASVELVMLDDLSGVMIDSLELSSESVPEPVSMGFAAVGLGCILWRAKRRQARHSAASSLD